MNNVLETDHLIDKNKLGIVFRCFDMRPMNGYSYAAIKSKLHSHNTRPVVFILFAMNSQDWRWLP